MNPIIQALYDRKSVRAYTGEAIPEEAVRQILTAASMAPTAGNQQLYTILRVTDPEKKRRLSESCDHQPFIAEAALVLVFCADCLKWYSAFLEAGCEPRRPDAGDLLLAVSDANIAAQNAVTAAEALGIGSCYIGDIMENCETQREILELPRYVFPAAMVVFGYPTEQQKTREKPERLDLRYTVRENAYRPWRPEELRAMFAGRSASRGYDEWMRAFCDRKYNSGFSREMSRSVRKYLEDYAQDGEGQAAGAMDALEAIFTRRSTRRLLPDRPPRGVIEQIIEAGRRAPSGSNSQTTHFIVITDPQALTDLAALVRAEFARVEAGPDTYVSLRNSIAASKKGDYVFHYGAPVLIVTANRIGYGNAMADSACALENMMIAANALDLGACWINQLHWLTDHEAVRDFMRGLGLAENETITGGLILGYGADGAPNRTELPRTGNPVTWVEG